MSKKRWSVPVPLHLKADDYSPDACEMRAHLYQHAFHATGGRGFMLPRGTGSKRKRPRRGWPIQATRVMGLLVTARYGERHVQ